MNKKVLILAIALVIVVAGISFASAAKPTPIPVIVGVWQNDHYTDRYTIYPVTAGVRLAQDVHSGITSPGTWTQESGMAFGEPYEYVWRWTFGPANPIYGNYIDYIHVVDSNHISFVNNYHDVAHFHHTATRVGNQPPTAAIQVAYEPPLITGNAITLDGSESADPDTPLSDLTYEWTVTKPDVKAKPVVTSNPNAAVTTFTPDTAGEYNVQLAVSDGTSSDTDTVTLTIEAQIRISVSLAPAGDGSDYRLEYAVVNRGSESVRVDAQATFWGLWQKYIGDADIRNPQKLATFKQITGTAPAHTTTILESELIKASSDQSKRCGEVHLIMYNAKIDGKPYSTIDIPVPLEEDPVDYCDDDW